MKNPWQLYVGKGLQYDLLFIGFEMNRHEVRKVLGDGYKNCYSRGDLEDSWKNFLGTSSWIRVEFTEDDKILEIELFDTKIQIDDILIDQSEDLETIIQILKDHGLDYLFLDDYDYLVYRDLNLGLYMVNRDYSQTSFDNADLGGITIVKNIDYWLEK